MGYDFSNFVLNVGIIPPGKKSTIVPLWSTNNPGIDSLFDLPVLGEMVVDLGLSRDPTVTVTLTFSFEKALEFLDSNLLSVGGGQDPDKPDNTGNYSILTYQFGYANGTDLTLSPPYTSIIFNPEVNISPTEATITLKGQGRDPGGTRQGFGRVLPKQSRSKLIREIFPPPFYHVDDSAVSAGGAPQSGLWFVDEVELAGGFGSKWFHALALARGARCWIVIGAEVTNGNYVTVLRILPIDATLRGKPRYRFQLYPGGTVDTLNQLELGPDAGLFPILSFTRQSIDSFLPNAVQGLVQVGIDDATGRPYRKVYKDKDTEGGVPMDRVGNTDVSPAGALPAPNDQTNDRAEPMPGDQATPQAAAAAHGTISAANNLSGIPVEIETFGIPDLEPGEIITVQGLGKRYDGNYAVFTITHTLGPGGFLTKFSARANTSEDGKLRERLQGGGSERVSGNVNKQQPDPGAAGTENKQPKSGT